MTMASISAGANANLLMDTVRGWLPGLIRFGCKLLLAVLIMVVGAKIIGVIYRMMKHSFRRMEMEESVSKFLLSLIRASMYCILVFVVAGQIGINSASIIALLGSAGIAIGLAVQGSLSNFAGGVLILMMKPFRVGDYILSRDGEGTVKVIGLVYTTLVTPDNKNVVIPNGNLANSPLTNVTAQIKRRVDIRVSIGYDADLKKAKAAMEGIFRSHPGILKEEEVETFVDGLEKSSVALIARGWSKTEDYWKVKWEITELVKLTFDELGITIPYEQMDIHLKTSPNE